MNKAILMGRLTRDPELRMTQTQVPVCTFTIAVDRRFKTSTGEKQADFIPIVAWRQQAEFANKYFRKGSRMLVVGSIQTRNWDDAEGKRHYATEVVADEIQFVDAKSREGGYDAAPAGNGFPAPASQGSGDGFFPAPDDDTALPFEL